MYGDEKHVPEPIGDSFKIQKKGSKQFRLIMEHKKTGNNFFNHLPQVKTFIKITDTAFTTSERWASSLGSWNLQGGSNRFRVFLLKYYGNILGTGNRVHHIDPSKDPSCKFCVLEKRFPAPIESFSHIFFDCPFVHNIVKQFTEKYFNVEVNKSIFFTGVFSQYEHFNRAANTVLDALRFCIWQAKLENRKLAFYTIELETLSLLDNYAYINKKFRNNILNCDFINADGSLGERVERTADQARP